MFSEWKTAWHEITVEEIIRRKGVRKQGFPVGGQRAQIIQGTSEESSLAVNNYFQEAIAQRMFCQRSPAKPSEETVLTTQCASGKGWHCPWYHLGQRVRILTCKLWGQGRWGAMRNNTPSEIWEELMSLILMPKDLRISCLSHGEEMASQVTDNTFSVWDTATPARFWAPTCTNKS